jgi:hypothetical protein
VPGSITPPVADGGDPEPAYTGTLDPIWAIDEQADASTAPLLEPPLDPPLVIEQPGCELHWLVDSDWQGVSVPRQPFIVGVLQVHPISPWQVAAVPLFEHGYTDPVHPPAIGSAVQPGQYVVLQA